MATSDGGKRERGGERERRDVVALMEGRGWGWVGRVGKGVTTGTRSLGGVRPRLGYSAYIGAKTGGLNKRNSSSGGDDDDDDNKRSKR